ncbi:hypothetical protein F511_26087 [Dorcoceras hygrometricum]|uniref:Uncharacterized protein n=1 Tax=Dorcoceras hygrometricum TaxID=472368 RepID=A0A2Z7CVA1_9LAMI|nr:hypothetical protein F511_26087 [Dorcoceras hygrometricum]
MQSKPTAEFSNNTKQNGANTPAGDFLALIKTKSPLLIQTTAYCTSLQELAANRYHLVDASQNVTVLKSLALSAESTGKVVAADVRSLLLMIVADLVLAVKVADLDEIVGWDLRVEDTTEVVVFTELTVKASSDPKALEQCTQISGIGLETNADVSFAIELARIVLCIGFCRQRLDWFVTTSFRLVEVTPFHVASRYLLLRSLPADNRWTPLAKLYHSIPLLEAVVGYLRNSKLLPDCAFCSAGCEGERHYRTLISLLGSLATMHRVVNYHSSWARQRQVELFDVSGNPGFTAGRGYNSAGGAPGGVLPIKPEASPDLTSITDYMASSPDIIIHHKRTS